MEKWKSYLKIWQELAKDKSMIFLTGPKQAGKTTQAKIIPQSYSNRRYFNWDIPDNRLHLIEDPVFFERVEHRDPSKPLIVLDEIHKYKDWKNSSSLS